MIAAGPGEGGRDGVPRWFLVVAAVAVGLLALAAGLGVAVLIGGDDDAPSDGGGGPEDGAPNPATASIDSPDMADTTTEALESSFRWVSDTDLAPVPNEPGTAPDLIGMLVSEDQELGEIARIRPGGEAVWRHRVPARPDDPAGSTGTTSHRVLGVAGDLVITYTYDLPGEEVTALDVDDGEVRWTRGGGPFGFGCGTCLAVVDDVLLSWGTGDLRALDTETGDELWTSTRAESRTTARPFVIGTMVVTTEVRDGAGEVVVLDAVTGTEVARITPTCSTATGVQGASSPGDRWVAPVPGTADIVVAFGDTATCVQRWSTAAGTTGSIWTATLPDGRAEGAQVVVGTTHALVSGTGRLGAVDLATGGAVELAPVAEAGGALVEPLAQVGPSALGSVPIEEGDAHLILGWDLGTSAPPWVVEVEGEGVALGSELPGQLDQNDRGVVVVHADPADHVEILAGERLEPLGIDVISGTAVERPSPEVVGPRQTSADVVVSRQLDDGLLVVVGGLPQWIDVDRGEVDATWPAAS